MDGKTGVGIIGAGRAAQSIHLPVLAGLCDDFAVRSIWDIDHALARAVCAQTATVAVPDIETLLDDPFVEVVAICSPAQIHAEQAIAALRAGKRAVLIEKPLCLSHAEAEDIGAAARATGAYVIAGTMHLFDPGWAAVAGSIEAQREKTSLVRSHLALPPNARFEAWATESQPRAAGGGLPQLAQAALMKLAVLELAIHDLPLIRRALPHGAIPRVTAARIVPPLGYALTIKAGTAIADLFALIYGGSQVEWTFEAHGDDASVALAFTPSFVQAGSATATVTTAKGKSVHGTRRANGYHGQWMALRRALQGDARALPALDDVLDDARFALDIAEQASILLAEGADA